MLRNQVTGNGYVRTGDPNFGIGILTGGDNVIEDNIVAGNVTGVRINAAATGNVIRANSITGNPPLLISNNAPDNAASGFDILNLSAAGANTFENNLCVTAMNAPCVNSKSTAPAIPLVTSISLDPGRVGTGSSFNATFAGNNVTSGTYFDVRFRPPGASSEQEVWNWQQGPSGSHTATRGTTLGDWTITGVRAHLDPNDHTGPFALVQATVSVFLVP